MRQLLLVCLLALAWATPSSARQDGPDPRRTRDRFAAYLERKPFHEQAFARLIESAAASDGVAALRTSYTERAALEDAEPATRIVLARILARDGELLAALELLSQLESQSTALDVLRGRLLLAADRPDKAAAVLAPAAEDPAGLDRRLAEELFGLLAQAHLATGARDAASAALRAQGELDPSSFDLALEIADALAQAGLQDAALVEYERAGQLAGQDSERLCRVLARSGRLHERRAEFELAIADYNAALGRLRRGHWLERELGARLGQAHATAGSLPAYAESLSERIAEHPADLGLRERLFRAKLDLHDPEGARLVLERATATHASDLPIGRLYSAHLDRMGRDEERAVELQRLIEEHPGEMDLYLDLGRLLARGGKLDQARRQWERSLEQRVGDVGFLLRLAQLFDRYGLNAEASILVERAIEQEPSVLSHFAELGGLALRAGDRAGVQSVLDRAEQVAGEQPARLEELASIARGLRRKGTARGYLERAVVLAPKDAHLWRLLATVAAEQRDVGRAVEALRQVLDVAEELTLKREALSQLVRRSQMAGNLESLIIKDLAGAQTGAAVPSLVVARAYRKQNRSRQALELLAAVTEPDDLVREEHANTLEELGMVDEAVALYEDLATERPARKVSYLREIVRLHRGEKNLEAAAEVVERILVASPNLPAVWRDAARSLEQLKQGERALEVMQRAVDLAPKDGAMRLAHAEMLLDNDQLERAIAAARQATESDDEDLVDNARAWLHKRLVGRGGVEPEIARLRAVLAANPYDDESALALIDLFERELEYSLALDLIGGLLDARPQAAQLLDLRAQLLDEMGRFEECLDDLERLKRLDALDVEQLAAREARAALALGQRDRAERALSRMPARRAASVYEKAGLEDEALACLEAERVRHPEDLSILQSLLRVQRARGNRPEAEALLDDLLLSEGESAQAFVRRGDLAFEFHDVETGITWYARSLALDTPEVVPAGLSQRESRRAQRRLNTEFSNKMSAIQTKLQAHQLWYASADVLVQAVRMRPDNSMLVARALSAYSTESRGSERMELLEFVRAETLGKDVLPPGMTAAKWEQELDSLQRRLIRSHPELARERSAELTDVAALSDSELKEALSLVRDQSDDEQLRRVAMEMLARSSEDRRALALLIELDLDGDNEEAAEAGMRRLLGMSTFVRARAKLQTLPRVPRKHQSREQAKLPESLRDAFTKEVAAQHYYLGRSARWKVGWGRTGSPNVESLIASLGFLLAEQGREAEARELLGELAPPSAYMVAHTAHLADLYRDLEWTQEADALEGPARAIVMAALADPALQSGV
ncbi:MAG: tetratricopeptide (TPR) repeat protein, partial [Planctomycetota bacterium]